MHDISRRSFLAHSATAIAAGGLPMVSFAQHVDPSRPVRMIIPYPAGGGMDGLGRAFAQALGDALGQSIVIDNRPGGAQLIATQLAATAPPDGYTIFLCSATHAYNPALVGKLPYDTVKDFAAITITATSPQILFAHPSLGVSNVKELVAKARANPGKINFGSSGPGSGGHLGVELLRSMADIDLVHVPYKGAAPALTDLLAGQVQLLCTTPLPAMRQVKAGKLVALGVTSPKRSAIVPELPTIAEQGYPGYEATVWYGLLVPVKTPQAIRQRLFDASMKALHSPEVISRLKEQGAEVVGNTPREAEAFIGAEIDRWTKIIRKAGIKGEV